MNIDLLNKFRQNLIDILQKWDKGIVNEDWVSDEAEEMRNTLFDDKGNYPQLKESDYHSITLEVISLLDSVFGHSIIKEDIPMLLNFLDTPKGKEKLAYKICNKYWDNIDWQEREKITNERYFNNSPN